MRALLLAILPLLAISGCSGAALDSAPDAGPGEAAATATTTIMRGEAAAVANESGGAKAVARSDGVMEFKLSYPATVGRIPQLARQIEETAEQTESEMRSDARVLQAERTDSEGPFNPHYLSVEWKVVADLPRFLSLSRDTATYTGGAHGMYDRDSLVWDRESARELQPVEMFVSTQALQAALRDRYCRALDQERRKRRGADWKPDGDFDACPELKNLTVLIGSSNGRTFDRLSLYAGPYLAGPYAEGAYEIDVPIDRAVLELVRPEYRTAFGAR